MSTERSETAKVPPKDWPWWWSTDEERYHGPCNSRGDAIMEAWADLGGEGAVFIVQATQEHNLNTDLFDGLRLAEMFDDANDEAQDPDGDGIAINAKDGAWENLAKRLNATMAAFVRDQGLTSWAFGDQTASETVDLAVNPVRVERLEVFIDAARAKFEEYAQHHLKKVPPDTAKATVNRDMARMATEALDV